MQKKKKKNLINQLIFEFFRVQFSFRMKCIRHLSIHSYNQESQIFQPLYESMEFESKNFL